MDDAILITLSGPATLAEAPRLRDELRDGLRVGRNVRIDLEASGPWDLIGLQLLVATAASADRDGTSVRFVKVPEDCLSIADRAGLRLWIDARREPTVPERTRPETPCLDT